MQKNNEKGSKVMMSITEMTVNRKAHRLFPFVAWSKGKESVNIDSLSIVMVLYSYTGNPCIPTFIIVAADRDNGALQLAVLSPC